MPGGGAVAIVEGVDEIAAADGFFIVGDGNVKTIRGFVGEIINAGEPSLAKIVRLAVETDTKVIDVVAPPFHTAPGFTEGVAAITDIESKCRSST